MMRIFSMRESTLPLREGRNAKRIGEGPAASACVLPLPEKSPRCALRFFDPPSRGGSFATISPRSFSSSPHHRRDIEQGAAADGFGGDRRGLAQGFGVEKHVEGVAEAVL